MRWPLWLVRLIPRLAPKARWADAVREFDADYLNVCDLLYGDVVARIRAVRPEAVLHPVFSRRLFVLDAPWLPSPYEGRWAVAFPEHDDGGNPGGNIVILKQYKHNHDLIAHEAAHLITRIVDHPAWLFRAGLALNV